MLDIFMVGSIVSFSIFTSRNKARFPNSLFPLFFVFMIGWGVMFTLYVVRRKEIELGPALGIFLLTIFTAIALERKWRRDEAEAQHRLGHE